MKVLLRLVSFAIAFCIPLHLLAKEPDILIPSTTMNVYRQCFIEGKNCTQARKLMRSLQHEYSNVNAEDAVRDVLASCKEARVNLATIKTEDAIIAHDYKLLECQERELSIPAGSPYAPLNWASIAGSYYATEYELGHMSDSQYLKLGSDMSDAESRFTNEIQQNESLKQEVTQLKEQLSVLESQDHQRCRAIQAMAAWNGGVPPACK
ncbi:hypothetical protein [Ferrovum sp.]|uniref:hypothetical protein n=1 Tax=Ferrovum sp. TaxID=2609467 RepID=UPI002601818F|nr:hypothetical protein [Ferrovum sp.]